MWHTVRMKSETSWKLEWKWKWSIIERRKRNMAPKSCQSRGEGEIFLQCLENREEKGNFFSRISKIEKRKRNFSQKSWQSRGEREFPDKNLKKREGKEKFFQKLLKIERRTRHENSFLQLERENSESFLLENFSRARLLSRTALCLGSLWILPYMNKYTVWFKYLNFPLTSSIQGACFFQYSTWSHKSKLTKVRVTPLLGNALLDGPTLEVRWEIQLGPIF